MCLGAFNLDKRVGRPYLGFVPALRKHRALRPHQGRPRGERRQAHARRRLQGATGNGGALAILGRRVIRRR
jgi:hypothetical protein